MFGLSQSSGYAIQAMSCLGSDRCAHESVASIAECTGIPKPYLAKIIGRLAAAEKCRNGRLCFLTITSESTTHSMKLSNLTTVLFASIIFCFTITGCGGKTTAVDSGTYEGSISKVNPAEKEIYVEITGGQKLELYFTPETTLTQNGETAAFEQLKAGQQVSVEVTRVGNRVDPVAVEILGQ